MLEQLEDAGVEITLIEDVPSPEGVVDKIERVTDALGLSEAGDKLADQVRDDFTSLETKVDAAAAPPVSSVPKVMFVLSTGRGAPMIGGAGTSADAIIRLTGAENAVTGLEGYKPLSPEAAVDAQPDVILTMNRSVELAGGEAALLAQPDIALTPAGRNQALISMDGLFLLGFGPRTPEAATALAAALAELALKPVN